MSATGEKFKKRKKITTTNKSCHANVTNALKKGFVSIEDDTLKEKKNKSDLTNC
jgi:hypothetical protein